MSTSNTNLSNQAEKTADELKALLREAETALSNTGDQVSEEVSGLRDRLRSALSEGKQTFSQAADVARRQAARADDMVRANPYPSIGVAAAAGVLVGFLICRSLRD